MYTHTHTQRFHINPLSEGRGRAGVVQRTGGTTGRETQPYTERERERDTQPYTERERERHNHILIEREKQEAEEYSIVCLNVLCSGTADQD